MRKIILCFLIAFSFQPNAHCENDGTNSGLVYGGNHAYFISAPSGWVLDNDSGKPNGLFAVFYPDGGSWRKSPAVMYTRAATKDSSNVNALEEFIKSDVEYMSEGEPNLIAEDQPSIEIANERPAIVKKFSGDAAGNIELVAYIEQPKSVAMIVLNARNQKEFDAAKAPFKALVQSYKFVTDKVKKQSQGD